MPPTRQLAYRRLARFIQESGGEISPISHRMAMRTTPAVSPGVLGPSVAHLPTRSTRQSSGHTHAMEQRRSSFARSNNGTPFGQSVIVTTNCVAAAASSWPISRRAANSCLAVGAVDPQPSQSSGRSADRETRAMSAAAVVMAEGYYPAMLCPQCGKPQEGRSTLRCLCSGVRRWDPVPADALNADDLAHILSPRKEEPMGRKKKPKKGGSEKC